MRDRTATVVQNNVVENKRDQFWLAEFQYAHPGRFMLKSPKDFDFGFISAGLCAS
jgi:hypothetical protein